MKRPAAYSCGKPASRSGKRRQALALATSQQRALERRLLGSLRDNLIRPYTLAVYHEALRWFFDWLDAEGVVLPSDPCGYDDIVCQAIEAAWDSGLARATAGNLLSGLCHEVNILYGQLKGGWRLWRKWGDLELPCRAPPLSLRAVLAMAYLIHEWGHPREALLLCLGFDRFLRTQEFLGLTFGQLTFHRKKSEMHIILPVTKTSRRKGRMESVHISDPLLVRNFASRFTGLEASDKLLSVSTHDFRRLFTEAAQACKLDASFKPYSLRRGGATAFFKECGKYDLTMEVGRWSDSRTCRIYVDTALLELTQLRGLDKPQLREWAAAFTHLMRS